MCWGAWGTPRASASFAKDAVCHEMQPSTYTEVSKVLRVTPNQSLRELCVNVGVCCGTMRRRCDSHTF